MTPRELETIIAQQPRRSAEWLRHRYADGRRAFDGGVGVSTPLWATFLAAAGAGAAFWWWTQWSRGKADVATNTDTGGAGAQPTAPETIMAHTPPPAGGPIGSVDKADEKLVEPAEALMAHAPVDPAGVAASHGKAGAKSSKARSAKAQPLTAQSGVAESAAKTAKTLDETLGVQGAPASKPPRKTPAKAAGKGPTIM